MCCTSVTVNYIPTFLLLGSRNSKANVCPNPGTLTSTPSGGSVILFVRLYISLEGKKDKYKTCCLTTWQLSNKMGLCLLNDFKSYYIQENNVCQTLTRALSC